MLPHLAAGMVGLTDVAALYSDGIPESIESHGMDFVQNVRPWPVSKTVVAKCKSMADAGGGDFVLLASAGKGFVAGAPLSWCASILIRNRVCVLAFWRFGVLAFWRFEAAGGPAFCAFWRFEADGQVQAAFCAFWT